MNKRSWSDDDVAEYEDLLDDALTEAAVAARRDMFLAGLDQGVQAHRYWALDVLRDMRDKGADRILKREQAARVPKVIVSGEDGSIAGSVPREYGVRRRDASGRMTHQRVLFDVMPWDELREKATAFLKQVEAYELDIRAIIRLLTLETKAPGTATPAEACARLGTTVEAWLSEGAA